MENLSETESAEDTAILQCRTARRLARTEDVVDITPGPRCGIVSTAPVIALGELQKDDEFSFRGARKFCNGAIVNQNLSCSFDPSNFMCLVCQKEHNILDVSRPVVIGLSD